MVGLSCCLFLPSFKPRAWSARVRRDHPDPAHDGTFAASRFNQDPWRCLRAHRRIDPRDSYRAGVRPRERRAGSSTRAEAPTSSPSSCYASTWLISLGADRFCAIGVICGSAGTTYSQPPQPVASSLRSLSTPRWWRAARHVRKLADPTRAARPSAEELRYDSVRLTWSPRITLSASCVGANASRRDVRYPRAETVALGPISFELASREPWSWWPRARET